MKSLHLRYAGGYAVWFNNIWLSKDNAPAGYLIWAGKADTIERMRRAFEASGYAVVVR